MSSLSYLIDIILFGDEKKMQIQTPVIGRHSYASDLALYIKGHPWHNKHIK
jgi:hypothetical protein